MTIVADYEGVEAGPWTPSQLKVYRESLLNKSKEFVDLINNYHVGGSVFEVGTGNGRLLMALADAGVLETGYGVDTSTSRIAFANQWAKDSGINIHFRVENFPHMVMPGYFDLAVCITGCFNYFPLEKARELLLALCGIADHSLFELYYPPKKVQALLQYESVVRVWDELPATDPWEFYLHEWSVREDGGYLHKKVFIDMGYLQIKTKVTPHPRKIDRREEVLYYYTPEEFSGMLRDAGFKKQCYNNYDGDRLVVIAK